MNLAVWRIPNSFSSTFYESCNSATQVERLSVYMDLPMSLNIFDTESEIIFLIRFDSDFQEVRSVLENVLSIYNLYY